MAVGRERGRGLNRFTLVVSLIAAGCQAALPQPRARLEDEGSVYLYLQPLLREAEGLRVAVESAAALDRSGRPLPLAVSLRELTSPNLRRQRLLAAGPLPAGEYAGFVLGSRNGAAGGGTEAPEAGGSATLTRVDFPFTVRRREALVVGLALRPTLAGDGVGSMPAVTAFIPDRPAVGRMAFVANGASDDVTIFDKKSREVFAAVATGRRPSGLVLDPLARKVYVALSGDDSVDVLDALSGRITDRIRLAPGDQPAALALTPDGRTLLSANRGSNTVSLIDPASRFELTKIPVDNGPGAVVVDPLGRRAFVLNALAGTVSVIDIPGRGVIRSIATQPAPVQADFNRRGDRLYVVHERSPFVTVINPVTLGILRRFPLRSGMDSIKVDPGTDLVYLGGRRDPMVSLHDPIAFAPVDVVPTAAGVTQMTADAEENVLYLVSPDIDRVLAYDRIRKRAITEVDVGAGPTWVAVMGQTAR